jgi:UPF0755 protein
MVVILAALWLGWALLLPLGPKETQFVLLRPGWTTRHIATELKAEGIIRSANAFLLYHYFAKPGLIKAGEYKFDQPANALVVHQRLIRGDIYKRTLLVPEGFNIFDIAAAVEAAGLGSAQDFLKMACTDTALIADIDPQAQTLEGYLFPDTYEFTRTQSLGDILSTMVRRFRQEARATGLLSSQAEAGFSPVDLHRIVTMASIVEKETAVPDERPLVAGVYYNRLAHKMALDADPSVIYAALLARRYQGAIHESDLQYDSRYNTYKYAGLPPGPIGNPGRASLEAAMHPATTKFLYFVSDNQGHHRFAATLEEHSRNVAAYRRSVNEGR